MGIRDLFTKLAGKENIQEDPLQFCTERVNLFSQNPDQKPLPNGIYTEEEIIDFSALNKGSILRTTFKTIFHDPSSEPNFNGYDWFVVYNDNLLYRIIGDSVKYTLRPGLDFSLIQML